MKKLLSILALTAFFGAASAQDGNLQLSVILGNNPMFNQSGTYLLPSYGSSSTGLASEPATYLNLGTVGSNSLTNMVGVQLGCYLGPLEVNAMFSMDISATPKKDYVEGISLDELSTPSTKYIDGSLKNNWYVNVGGNFHLSTKKVGPYGGVRLGYSRGSIQTNRAYTGDIADESLIYYPTHRAGFVQSIQAAIVGGAECVTNCGIVFGVEFFPVAYQYSVIDIDPSGEYNYVCNHHSVKFFSTPTCKLGLRF